MMNHTYQCVTISINYIGIPMMNYSNQMLLFQFSDFNELYLTSYSYMKLQCFNLLGFDDDLCSDLNFYNHVVFQFMY